MEYDYTISDAGCIVAVSDNWDAFAEANDGERARAEHVLGRPWSDFVSGEEVRYLFRKLLMRAAAAQRPLAVPFRCDGPAVRRPMEMLVLPQPDKSVSIRCTVLDEEPRETLILLKRDAVRDARLLKMCSWCCQVFVHTQWVEVEEAIRILGLFNHEPLPSISHSICGPCLADLG